jgi:hypothetical protein
MENASADDRASSVTVYRRRPCHLSASFSDDAAKVVLERPSMDRCIGTDSADGQEQTSVLKPPSLAQSGPYRLELFV